jgi:hypothetical protein
VDVVKSDNADGPERDDSRDEAPKLDPKTVSLLMFGGDETEHDLAEHPDAEEVL